MDTPILLVVIVYGVYAFISLCMMVMFREAVVMPYLRHAKKENSVNQWKDAFKWGFFYLWMYFTAVALLIPYRAIFAMLKAIFRVDLRTSRIWNAKEQRFFHATPKILLEEWVRDYFAKYYLPVFPK